MPNRLESLLSEAQSEPSLNRPRYAQYRTIVRTLLEKGWSYRRVFEWLVAKGEPLEEKHFSRFRVAISTAASRSRQKARIEAEATPIPVPEELPDEELDRICESKAMSVNTYLRNRGHIRRDQTYRSMPPAFRARVMKNPAAFLKACQAWKTSI